MKKDIWNNIRNLSIRSRLLYGYLVTFLLVVCLGSFVSYLYFRITIDRTVAEAMSSRIHAIRMYLETAVQHGLVSQLRAIAEQNQKTVTSIYQRDLTEKEAKQLASQLIEGQVFGDTGVVYVVNSHGNILVHPDNGLVGKNIPAQNFMNHHSQSKYGYLESGKITLEGGPSSMNSLFMTYFGPWDWIITAAVDTKEKLIFFDIKDIRKSILAVQTVGSELPFIMDSKGNLLIHASREGQNIFDELNTESGSLFKAITDIRAGSIKLPWPEPGLKTKKDVILYYHYLPDFDWIIVLPCDPARFHRPLSTLRLIILATLAFLIVLAFALTWKVGNSITEPIKRLTRGFRAVTRGDYSIRLTPESNDELGQLESYFNTFIEQLEESNSRLNESEKGFRSIFENSVEAIFQFDMEGNILKVNPSFVSMFGYSGDQDLLDSRINFHTNLMVNRDLWSDLIDLVNSERVVKGFELQLYKKSGAVFWGLLNAGGIHETHRGEVRIEGFLSDINAIKQAQSGQEKIREELETMVARRTVELSTRISELEEQDAQNRYISEMGDMLQSCRSIEETFPVIGQYLRKLFPDDTCSLYLHDSSRQNIDRVLPPVTESDICEPMTNDSCWALRRGKSYHFKELDDELVCDHVGGSFQNGYICNPLIAHGVTIGLLHIMFAGSAGAEEDNAGPDQERKVRLSLRLADHLSLALANLKLQEELKVKSTQDSLTGLANRRYMEEIMQRQFHRLLRYNSRFSLIMLDVDHFKKFNDNYGHDMGDHVLSELGNYLNKNIRGEDLACRFGGEEFIIIMVDSDTDGAARKAEKIRREVSEKISIPHFSETIHITVSAGVATAPEHGRDATELLKSVDNALYKAKANGRNRVEVATVNP